MRFHGAAFVLPLLLVAAGCSTRTPAHLNTAAAGVVDPSDPLLKPPYMSERPGAKSVVTGQVPTDTPGGGR